MSDIREGALVALDWGTSSLRATLLAADGTPLDRREKPWGIMHLPAGGFDAAYVETTEGWHAPHAIACGMIGSAQGWAEIPYVAAPAGAAEIAAGLGRVKTPHGPPLHIVPGVNGSNAGGQPNVMRGEETQIIGALADADPDATTLFVLPGTHSKWVHVAEGRIGAFETFMTGELFALLSTHSILGRPARDAAQAGAGAGHEPAFSRGAFARGLVAARGAHQGLGTLLFSARTEVLSRHIRADESLDYLSGLLIGDELRAGFALHGAASRVCTLIAAPALAELYGVAFDLFGAPPPRVTHDAALTGLLLIARAAGLLPPELRIV